MIYPYIHNKKGNKKTKRKKEKRKSAKPREGFRMSRCGKNIGPKKP